MRLDRRRRRPSAVVVLLQQAVVPGWHRYVVGFLTARRPRETSLPLLFASGTLGSECEAAARLTAWDSAAEFTEDEFGEKVASWPCSPRLCTCCWPVGRTNAMPPCTSRSGWPF